MLKHTIFLAITLLLSLPAWADMYPDASNAKLPEARTNLRLQPVMATDIGFVGDGVTTNNAAMAALFARTDSPTVYFPTGTYMMSCPAGMLQTFSAVSLLGASSGSTIIKFPPGCTLSASIYMWYGGNIGGARVSNLTFDLNTPATPTAPKMLLYFAAHNANVNGGSFDHLRVINGTGFMYLLYAEAANGSLQNFHMDDNYLHITAPDNVNGNQCAATSMQSVGSLVTKISIDRNICVNTGIQLDGINSSVSFNDISGYGFGTAIYSPFTTSHHLTVIGNRMHDSALTRDSNNVLAGGMEAVDNSVICNNMFWNLGGTAINNFGKNSMICSNVAYNNSNSPLAAAGTSEQAAFHSVLYGGSKFGANTRWVGNKAYDDRATPKQLYGYFDWAGDAVPGINFSGNDFHGYLGGKAYAIGMGTNSDPNPAIMQDWVTLGPRKSIYRAPSIEFTNIDTSFTQYKLTCSGLGPYLAGTLAMQFGYGTGPTWITGATDYTYGGSFVNLANTTPTVYSGDSNGMKLATTIWGVKFGQVNQNLLTAQFGALWYAGSDAVSMSFQAAYASATGFQETSSGMGLTLLTANPITAIRILSTDPGIVVSGICSLQGIL